MKLNAVNVVINVGSTERLIKLILIDQSKSTDAMSVRDY